MTAGIKNNPGDSDITKYLIVASLNTGKQKDAISLIEDYIKNKPEDVSTLIQLAGLYEKTGRLNDSLKIYKKVLELSPDNEKAQEAYLRLRLEALE